MKKSIFTFTVAAMIIAALMLTASNTGNTCTNAQQQSVCQCGTVWTYHTTTCTNEEELRVSMAEFFRQLADYHGESVPTATKFIAARCKCDNANPDFVSMSLYYRVLSEEELRAALATTGAGNWIFSENACGKESKIARVRRITRVHGIATHVLIVPSQSAIVSGETVNCWRLYFGGGCR